MISYAPVFASVCKFVGFRLTWVVQPMDRSRTALNKRLSELDEQKKIRKRLMSISDNVQTAC
jgi:hypothetical protein